MGGGKRGWGEGRVGEGGGGGEGFVVIARAARANLLLVPALSGDAGVK